MLDEYKKLYLKSILNFRNECEKAIGDSKIKVCIENSDGYADFQIEALDTLLLSPVFCLTFDIGHNHSIGGTDEPVIIKRSNHIYHIHMHDALGKKIIFHLVAVSLI